MNKKRTFQASETLKAHGLRKTAVREDVLKAFQSSPSAISHSELEKKLTGKYDRVTLYRTLKSFEQSGILHEVIDNEAVVKYAKCHHNCSSQSHTDNHLHFKCQQCGTTTCIDQSIDIPFELPEGYTLSEVKLLAMGTCQACQ